MIFKAELQVQKLKGINSAFFDPIRNLLVGFIGEEIFQWAYPDAIRTNTYDHDFLLKGKRIDVKTKIFNRPPKPHFETTFHLRKIPENDYFVLCSVDEKMKTGYLIGFIDNSRFFNISKRNLKGDLRPNDGKPYYADGYSIKIEDFRPL